MLKISSVTLILLIISSSVSAQKNRFTIQLSNPLGMFQKTGLKIEHRTKGMGVLLGAIQYYGVLPRYPGTQLGLELRKYIVKKNLKDHENFFYLKFIAGHQNYFAGSGSGFTRLQEVPEGDYAGAGGGVGRRFNFELFFIDFNTGLKYVISEVEQSTVFYITGPASFIDFHIYVGIPF